uniref:Uncharacterized protein n=1 Tax=Anolis carolinensis TaxID=28377 RepID=A0A803TDM6_ANOCA
IFGDRRTPDVRFRPWDMPFPGPSESSETINCRGLTTGIPKKDRGPRKVSSRSNLSGKRVQFGLVLFVPDFLLLHITAREEEAHHAVEELVGQLDGEGHHIDLEKKGESDHQAPLVSHSSCCDSATG